MTTPQEDFERWWGEHYEAGERTENRVLSRCRRCGESVGWVTKHAAERHGDQITVMEPMSDADPMVASRF